MDALLKRYNCVTFKQTGIYFLVECYTHNRQYFIIFGKQRKQVESIVDSHINGKDDTFKVKGFYEIMIRDCAKKTFLKAAKRELDCEMFNFRLNLCFDASRYFDHFGSYPKGFKKCENCAKEDNYCEYCDYGIIMERAYDMEFFLKNKKTEVEYDNKLFGEPPEFFVVAGKICPAYDPVVNVTFYFDVLNKLEFEHFNEAHENKRKRVGKKEK